MTEEEKKVIRKFIEMMVGAGTDEKSYMLGYISGLADAAKDAQGA